MTSRAQTPSVIMLKSTAGDDPIELQGEVVIGRGSMCNVILEKERLSRQHAKLSVGKGNLLVEDLGSTNGTFVNDVKVNKATLAKHGDIIRFDHFAYQVCVVGADDDSESTLTDESAVPETEVLDARTQVFTPPKSWALGDNSSSEGTQVMSLDMLQQTPGMNDESIAQKIETSGPVLVGLSGQTKGKVFQFNTRDKLTKWEIGRDESCDICLDDSSVSSNHAQLIHEGQRWKLVDLMSANGTYVNANKGLTSYLSSGDKVRFGQVEFVFKLGEQATIEEHVDSQDSADSTSFSVSYSWALGGGAFLITAVVLYFIVL